MSAQDPDDESCSNDSVVSMCSLKATHQHTCHRCDRGAGFRAVVLDEVRIKIL